MPQIDIMIQGRAYSVQCQEGEEKRAHYLAAHINRHAARLVARLGNMPDAQLLLMTSMTVADELLEVQEKLQHIEQQGTVRTQMGIDGSDTTFARRIRATTSRLENITEMLQPDMNTRQGSDSNRDDETSQNGKSD